VRRYGDTTIVFDVPCVVFGTRNVLDLTSILVDPVWLDVGPTLPLMTCCSWRNLRVKLRPVPSVVEFKTSGVPASGVEGIVPQLWPRIRALLRNYSYEECLNFFRHAGYASIVLTSRGIGEWHAAEEAFMRTIPLAFIAFAALSLSTTGARADGSWCANYGTGHSGINCSYTSQQQCIASVSGIYGFCTPNPYPGTGYGRGGSWNLPPSGRARSNRSG